MHELGAKAVVVRRLVEADLCADLFELLVALVQEQLVAHAVVVGGEPLHRARDGVRHVGVAGDEEVRTPIAVHVGHGSAGVPAEGNDPRVARALRERAVTVVPEQEIVRRGGDEEIGVAVAVEVGGDAALTAERQANTGLRRDVGELAVVVAVQVPGRQAAVCLPRGQVVVGVAVDGEQVEPAIVVVVQPAEAAAHHRLRVVRHSVAEGALAEIDPALRCNVGERDATDRRGCLYERRPGGPRAELPARAVLVQAVRDAGELGDRVRRVLARTRFEVNPHRAVVGSVHGRHEVAHDRARGRQL